MGRAILDYVEKNVGALGMRIHAPSFFVKLFLD
jgi:hypothetical protein